MRKLVECVSKGGNLLLNVGPDARGRFPQPALDILREVGTWLRGNGESVYGAGASTLPKPEWGRYTQHGDTVYAHVLEAPVGPLALTPLRPDQVTDIRLIADGTDLPLAGGWHSPELNENALVAFGPDQTSTYPLPDPVDTVLAVRLSER